VPRESTDRLSGPLAEHARGFRTELAELGYSTSAAKKQVQMLAHLSHWLEATGRPLAELNEANAGPFFEQRRQDRRGNLLTTRSLAPLLGYLRRSGAVPRPQPPAPIGPTEVLLARYRTYLLSERGLAQGTARSYLHVARMFVTARPERHELGLEGSRAAEVMGFVSSACSGRSTSSTRQVVSALRCFLRFLQFEGVVPPTLDNAVLSVAGWAPPPPRAASPAQVEAIMASCDRSSALGLRDYAILALLARLGLRDGEVVRLGLDDIDWRAGELAIERKGGRRDRLPLPADVGEAIAGYLVHGRPHTSSRRVFVRHFAPKTGLAGTGAVTHLLAKACQRAGCAYVNPHGLRHSLASQMLAAGVSLYDIGQVLGHASATATATYAKVDPKALVELARPWPEVAP